MFLAVGAATDQGRVRPNNEDQYALFLEPGLPLGIRAILVVADGMGGHQAGEIASGLVINGFADWLRSGAAERIVLPSDLPGLLVRVIEDANQRIFTAASGDARLRGMGTTVVAAAITDGRVVLAHVGDSRAYLIENENIYQLTRDHSWVAEQVRAGLLTSAEARRHPRRNVLTRAVGIAATVSVETGAFEIDDGDILLLCTDGLTSLIADQDILRIAVCTPDPSRAARALVELANQRGSPDNVTVVIARIGKAGTSAPEGGDRTIEDVKGSRP
ncbi:MAG: Stp1/IreP family PP2C-type Ser/Thr phosphatase [Chloroflexi bacterium]|nr:Stp1/IreP family PP2C-type Ser/Thr phosphatase [Chloroflexota bacterium]